MEQPGLELAPIWDAGIADRGLTCYAMAPAPKALLSLSLSLSLLLLLLLYNASI